MRTGAYVHKFGFNSTVATTSDPEDIWDAGGLYTWPTTAGGMSIVSSTTSDGSTGTGARTVTVEGCSTAYRPLTETITMTGSTAAVSLAGDYWRVYRAFVVTAGSAGVNNGTLSISQSTSATTAQISAARGQSLMGLYTVNDLSTAGVHSGAAYLTGWYASVGRQASAGFAEVNLMMRRPGEATRVQDVRTVNTAGNGDIQVRFAPWLPLTVGADVWVRVETVSATVAVSGGFGVVYSDPNRLYGV